MRLLVLALSACGSLLAQTVLAVAPASASAGERVSVDIILTSPAGAGPVALQWEFTFPAGPRGFRSRTPAAGPIAKSASKSLACSGRWRKAPVAYTYACILSGGRNPVPSGIIGTVELDIPASAKPNSYPLELDRAKAVNVTGAQLPLKVESARLVVHPSAGSR